MTPTITPTYASVLTLLFFLLSFRTLKLRRRLSIAIGDGSNSEMLRAMRVHSNFAEYVPLTLVLLLSLELGGRPAWAIHGLAGCLALGRVIHAFGLSQDTEDFRYRVTGMALTFTAMLGAAGWLLLLPLRARHEITNDDRVLTCVSFGCDDRADPQAYCPYCPYVEEFATEER